MEVLLAAPGTGKTTKIKNIIDERFTDAKSILVLSFTNATINDLNTAFKDYENVKCYTLHKYALSINHLPLNHILCELEIDLLQKFSEQVKLSFSDLCNRLECMTFEMMISESISFIKINPAYAKDTIGDIDLLVVDEFQDFNELERNLLNILFEFAKNAIVLGDDDQSIYSFKNADPEALIEIYKDASNPKIAHDHICYRCPDIIVDSCTTLIENNTIRVKKDWHKSKKTGNLFVLQGNSHGNISKYIIDKINELKQSSSGESLLILCQYKISVSPIMAELQNAGIDFVDFLKKDIEKNEYYLIWWLRAIFGRHQLLNIIFIITHLKLHKKTKLIEKLKDYFKDTSQIGDLMEIIMSYSTYLPDIAKYLNNTPDIQDFLKEYAEYETFKDNIDINDISNSVEEVVKKISTPVLFDPAKVNIMTIYKSKGLQADNVFILGLTEGLLPNRSEGTDNIEAQRRLLYVGMTRAKKRLWLFSCINWATKDIFGSGADKKQFKFHGREVMKGKTSSFISEMHLPVRAI